MEKNRFHESFHRNERLIMISDGVFAIVLTLLILELHVPSLIRETSANELWLALAAMKNKIFGFVLSFVFIINLWFSHNVLFKCFIRFDNTIIWLNNIFLLLICFVPFPTALIGEYPDNPAAMMLFGVDWILIPVVIYWIGGYALRKKFVAEFVDRKRYLEARKLIRYLIPFSIVPFVIAAFLPRVAFFIYLFILITGIVMGFRIRLDETS
jgi:uncharacterized membrane protein